ncbi:uncharacterized protein LOC119796595 [Cyprinodon tularosa]|uniref:uncharacterized protein LOC119796595 n=1 Tax=Cyprinodon tularosa TaxID=77115 RepID=UPI0018E23F20|nr:uncharacterized protein LOC119796595 [Cyprinodon tularosa]
MSPILAFSCLSSDHRCISDRVSLRWDRRTALAAGQMEPSSPSGLGLNYKTSCLAVKSSEPSEENETFFSESSLGSKPAAAAGSSPVMVVNSSDEAIYENSQELDAAQKKPKSNYCFYLLLVAMGMISALLLVSIAILAWLGVEMMSNQRMLGDQEVEMERLKEDNQKLVIKKCVSEVLTEQLSRERDDLKVALEIILMSNIIPSDQFCSGQRESSVLFKKEGESGIIDIMMLFIHSSSIHAAMPPSVTEALEEARASGKSLALIL